MSEINMDVDALLDGTLDDLADMPEFKPFPIGSHRAIISMEVKKIGDFPAVELTLKAIETIELPAGSEEAPLNKDDSTNLAFFLKHSNPKVAEMGQGQFKEIMKVAAAKFGAKSNRELIEECKGVEALIVTGQRKNKEKTKTYTTLEAIEFV